MTTELDLALASRFCRHILLPKVGDEGQERLLNSHVLVIGAGGLGSAAIPYLAASGIGRLTIYDGDAVDSSNLQRQIIHNEAGIGVNKAHSAAHFIQQLNHYCAVYPVPQHFTDGHFHAIADADIVIDCSDNLATRQLINQGCWHHHTPLVSGSAIRMEGQLVSFAMQPSEPCYACLASLFGEQQLSCMEAGILSPVVGTIGSLQATEAIRRLLGWVEQPAKLLLYDAFSQQFQHFTVPKQQHCPVCSTVAPSR